MDAIEGPKATKCNDTCSVRANDSDSFCKENKINPINTDKNTLTLLFKPLSVFSKKTAAVRSIAIKKMVARVPSRKIIYALKLNILRFLIGL